MPSGVPLEVLHAMQTQVTLAIGYPGDGEEYEGWGRVREAEPYIAPPSYTSAELTQLREAGLPFTGVPNYMDVSICRIWRFVTRVYRYVRNHCTTIKI